MIQALNLNEFELKKYNQLEEPESADQMLKIKDFS